jgi:hypothetical protein
MQRSSKDWLVPLTGVAFILVVVASIIVLGDEPPSADDGGQEIIDFYVDKDTEVKVAGLLGALAAVLLVFFFARISKLVSAASQGPTMLPTVAIVGAGIFATGIAIDSTLQFALAEAGDDLDPTAAQAIQGIWDSDFIPFVVGLSLMMLATGIGVVRTGVLPKWLGWVAVVAGIFVFAGPIGFISLPVTAIWILISSVMLTMRARSGATA